MSTNLRTTSSFQSVKILFLSPGPSNLLSITNLVVSWYHGFRKKRMVQLPLSPVRPSAKGTKSQLLIQRHLSLVMKLHLGSNLANMISASITNSFPTQEQHDPFANEAISTTPNDLNLRFWHKAPGLEERNHHSHDLLYPPPPAWTPSTISQAQPRIGQDSIYAAIGLQENEETPIQENMEMFPEKLNFSRRVPTTSRRAKTREKWASIKDEVEQYYMIECKTLESTMAHFEQKYSFRAR